MVKSFVINSPKRIPPIVAFFGTFSIVMTILILTTDLKVNKQQRKNLVLRPDADVTNFQQDDPRLVQFIQQNFLKVPGMLTMSNNQRLDLRIKSSAVVEKPIDVMTNNLGSLIQNKLQGIFIEVGAYSDKNSSETEYLENVLNWSGLLIQPDPFFYKILLQHNRNKSHSINACVSPSQYSRQVSFKTQVEEEEGTEIPEYKKVFCFPLYSLFLAFNETKIDFLSINAHGAEFQVLKTLPWSKINITAISVFKNKQDSAVTGKLIHLLKSHFYELRPEYNNENHLLFIKTA